ncbi:MAG: pyridoxamine 5'-phosphate oxidase family protein [Candidatus Bathyarchaeia archaeon]
MVKVSENIMEAFNLQKVIPMATVNKNGVPNVIYVAIWWWEDNETLCVVNNYLNKTLQNIEDNGKVSFVCFGKNGSFQIKCETENITEGPIYEKGHKIATDREKPLPGRSTIVCKVVEIYQGSGGKGAGDKLA